MVDVLHSPRMNPCGPERETPAMTGLKLLAVIALWFVWLNVATAGGDKEHGFLHRVHHDADGKAAKYVLFVPHDYTDAKEFPLILFLHGRGESGSDGQKQAKVGIGPAIKKQEKTFPFLVIMPQSQKNT